MQQKSQVAPAFLKRRIRPRYIRIKVNAKFPRASRHFRWLTPTTAVPWKQWGRVGEGEGASGNWEERKRNEDESERTTEENGYFFFFWRQVQRRGKNGRRWLWNLHQSEGWGMWKEKVWKEETSGWMKRRESWLENEKGIVRIKYLYFFVYER